jgi:CRP/FNR family transcriptional regulator, cyclic AMP receptor protein
MEKTQRIYRIGDASGRAYVAVTSLVQISTVDEIYQEVILDQPAKDDFFGFASMIDQTPRQTSAVALEETVCIEIGRHDISILLERKPLAGNKIFGEKGKPARTMQLCDVGS